MRRMIKNKWFTGPNHPLSIISLVVTSALSQAAWSGNVVTTIAGVKPTIWADITQAKGASNDASGNIFITNSDQHQVLKIGANNVVEELVGTGNAGYSGDGDLANKARLSSPQGIVVDNAGNLYIADTGNHTIRKVDVNNVITTIAGTGIAGFSGDNGDALLAQLDTPTSIAIDSNNNIFITDMNNQRIRMIDSLGVITTIAGTGLSGFSGDGGPATNAQFANPQFLIVDDSDALYIADSNNHRIRKIVAGQITTIVGTGTAGFSGDTGPAISAQLDTPNTLAFDANNHLLIGDSRGNRVRKVDDTQTITTIAGGGETGFANNGKAAIDPETKISVQGFAFDAAGELIIVDQDAGGRRIDADGNINTWAGQSAEGFTGDNGIAIEANIYNPAGITKDNNDNIYFADSSNHRIRKIDSTGIISTVAGNGGLGYSGDNGLAVNAMLNFPHSIVFKDNALYVADTANSVIRKIDLETGLISTAFGTGVCGFDAANTNAASTPLCQPLSLMLDADGNFIVADSGNYIVRKIDQQGVVTTIAGTPQVNGLAGMNGPAAAATIGLPKSIAINKAGLIHIADEDNNVIHKVDANGNISIIAGGGDSVADKTPALETNLRNPQAIIFDKADNLYVSSNASTLRKVDKDNIMHDVICDCKGNADGKVNLEAEINVSLGLFTDTGGNIFIGDTGNSLVRKIAYIPVEAKNDGTVLIDEDAPATPIAVLNNDLNGEGAIDVSGISILTPPENGVVSVNTETGEVNYTPNENYFGTDNFTYQVSDINGVLSNEAAVDIQVKGINDLPTISPIENQAITNDKVLTMNVTIGDAETSADNLVAYGLSSNSAIVRFENIVFSTEGDVRTLTVTPVAGAVGEATITVVVQDETNAKSTLDFMLKVDAAPENGAPDDGNDGTPGGSEDTPGDDSSESDDSNSEEDNTSDDIPEGGEAGNPGGNPSENPGAPAITDTSSSSGGGGSASWMLLLLGLLGLKRKQR